MACGKGYHIRLSNNDKHKITRAQFVEWAARHLIEPVGDRTARLCSGVGLYLCGGKLFPVNVTDVGVSIPSSWRMVERARVFATNGIKEDEARRRAIEENYGPPSVANEMTWPNVESFGSLGENK